MAVVSSVCASAPRVEPATPWIDRFDFSHWRLSFSSAARMLTDHYIPPPRLLANLFLLSLPVSICWYSETFASRYLPTPLLIQNILSSCISRCNIPATTFCTVPYSAKYLLPAVQSIARWRARPWKMAYTMDTIEWIVSMKSGGGRGKQDEIHTHSIDMPFDMLHGWFDEASPSLYWRNARWLVGP